MRNLLTGSLLLLILLAGSLAVWFQRALTTPLPVTQTERFEVEAGSSLRAVLTRLEQRGWLRGAIRIEAWGRFDGTARRMHAGEYELVPGIDGRTLLEMLAEGRVVSRQLVLLEGWRFQDVRRVLAAAPRLLQSTVAMSDEDVMAALDREGVAPEGRFFPDTYDYVAGDSDLELLARALARMDQVLAEEWARRLGGLPLADPAAALTLASLIEKETGVAADREMIAGVFVRRLERGMRLQTDPSVIYGLGADFDGNLRRADLRNPHPWNTYMHSGLPPSPIAIPGRASIRAALHPAQSDALYFVARGDGSSEFSATLAEHNAAVRRYQIDARAEDYRSSPAREQR